MDTLLLAGERAGWPRLLAAGAPQLCGGGASVAVETKKRVPLTTIVAGPNAHPGPGAGATPEKAKGKGRRVDLITLSSPKTKT